MWYIINADAGSKLITGFSKNIDQNEYQQYLKNDQIESLLHYETVNSGDTFFIPTGTVHAIGAGILLAEIQQTSDVTYRIFDWNRKDKDGNTRELHTALALDAIDFSKRDDNKVKYDQTQSQKCHGEFFLLQNRHYPLGGGSEYQYESVGLVCCFDGCGWRQRNHCGQQYLSTSIWINRFATCLFEFIYNSGKPFKSIDDYHLASIILFFSICQIIPQLFSITRVSNIVGHRVVDSVEKTFGTRCQVI